MGGWSSPVKTPPLQGGYREFESLPAHHYGDSMRTEHASDVKDIIRDLVDVLGLEHVDVDRIFCYRSFNAKTDAVARIWSLAKLWQKALDVKAHYIIEVVSENFDHLDQDEKEKTMLHEILHIPKNFSGSLLNHTMVHFDGKGGHKKFKINRTTVNKIYKDYMRARDPVR